jgi:hypothetical protein
MSPKEFRVVALPFVHVVFESVPDALSSTSSTNPSRSRCLCIVSRIGRCSATPLPRDLHSTSSASCVRARIPKCLLGSSHCRGHSDQVVPMTHVRSLRCLPSLGWFSPPLPGAVLGRRPRRGIDRRSEFIAVARSVLSGCPARADHTIGPPRGGRLIARPPASSTSARWRSWTLRPASD